MMKQVENTLCGVQTKPGQTQVEYTKSPVPQQTVKLRTKFTLLLKRKKLEGSKFY